MAREGDRRGLERRLAEQETILRETVCATDEESVRRRGIAFWRIAEDRLQLGQLKEAVEAFERAIPILWQFASEQNKAVSASGRQANALMGLDRQHEALDLLNELVERVGLQWRDPANPDLLAGALGPWLFLMEGFGLVEAAYAAANAIIDAYEPPASVVQRLLVAGAFRTKGAMALARGDDDEAQELLSEAISRCALENGDGFLSIWAEAVLVRGRSLEQTDQSDLAVASYANLIDKCGGTHHPYIEAMVAEARERISTS